MKSVFPDKEVFNNYDLNLNSENNTVLEFILKQYPEYIFCIETKLKNRVVKPEKDIIISESRTKEYCTIIIDSASNGNIDIDLLVEKFPYMTVTNKMIKSLNSELVLEYKNELYKQISKKMAISLLEISMFGIVDENIFTIVNDKKTIEDMEYVNPKVIKEDDEEEDDELE